MVTKGIIAQRKLLQVLLRQVRLDAGLRQSDVAARLHQKQSYVSKYELGEHRLDLPQLDQVCTAIGISLEEFVQMYKRALVQKLGDQH